MRLEQRNREIYVSVRGREKEKKANLIRLGSNENGVGKCQITAYPRRGLRYILI